MRQIDRPALFWLDAHYSGGETAAVLDSLTLLSMTATAEGRPVVIRRISEQLQENAELLRTGSIHRNTYLNFPARLNAYGAPPARADAPPR